MATILPTGETTFFDANGRPLAGGFVYFYIPGTTTPKDTWINPDQTTLNTNPIILDAAGRAIIYGAGSYRQVVKDSVGNVIWDQLTSDTSASQVSWGGTATGTANAIIVTAANFSLTTGQQIAFIASTTNTGATTLNVNGYGALPLLQDSPTGPQALTGGEIIAGAPIQVLYDDAIGGFHLTSATSPYVLQSLIAKDSGLWYAAQYGVSVTNTAAQNTNALNALIALALSSSPSGGIIQLPHGKIQLNALTTINSALNLILRGVGKYSGGTELNFSNSSGECLSFSSCQYSGVEDCYITSSVRKTSDFCIKFSDCFHGKADVRIDYQYNGILYISGSEAEIDVEYRYMFGTVGTQFGGATSTGLYGATILSKSDNPYPTNGDGVVRTYSSGLSVTNGQILWCPTSRVIYQVTQSGNLGPTEPSTIGGTGTADAFTTQVTSGTAGVTFVARAIVWTLIDSFAYSVRFERGSFALNGYEGCVMVDNASTGSSYPQWVYLTALETDHTIWHGMEAYRGQSLYCEDAWLGSSRLGRGLMIDVGFIGDVSSGEGARVYGNALEGIYCASGSKNVRISGSIIAENSQLSSGTYSNIMFDGTQDFTVTGARVYGTKTKYGINLNTGSDFFTVTGNSFYGNVTAGINNVPGTAATRVVANNIAN